MVERLKSTFSNQWTAIAAVIGAILVFFYLRRNKGTEVDTSTTDDTANTYADTDTSSIRIQQLEQQLEDAEQAAEEKEQKRIAELEEMRRQGTLDRERYEAYLKDIRDETAKQREELLKLIAAEKEKARKQAEELAKNSRKPSIISFASSSVETNGVLIIVGTNLDVVNQAAIGGIAVPIVSKTSVLLQLRVIPSAPSGYVRLGYPGGIVQSVQSVTVKGASGGTSGAKPSITRMVLSSGQIAANERATLSWETKDTERVYLKIGANETALQGTTGSTSLPLLPVGATVLELIARSRLGEAKQTKLLLVTPASDRRPDKPLPPSTPNPPVVTVPGNYPTTCNGVRAAPPDHPGANVANWITSSNNPAQRAGKALAWMVSGQQGGLAGTPSKLGEMATYLQNTSNYARINQQRRNRGLRALSVNEFASMLADVQQRYQAGGRRDAFPNDWIQTMWNKYHMPYKCG